MSVPITINGTTVQFPSSGADPNWSQALIQAIQLISEALNISAGTYDIAPQSYTMTANVNTNVAIPNLSFPTNAVQGAVILYSVLRSTTGAGATAVSETGLLTINYDTTAGSGSKFQVNREYVGPGGQITFSCSDLGQMQFSTTSITGSSHTGTIYFRALAVLQS